MMQVRIVDVTADASFRLIPPCADPGFDHRTCDYWEDADRGSKAARASWLEAAPAPPPAGPAADNPFAPPRSEPDFNPFARTDRSSGPAFNPFADDDVAVAYAQFGPLSAYPRAQRLRDLYPQLPEAPLPAVITCIATTAEARGQGHAAALVRDVCDDLARRGFAAVEAYPERGTRPDATSAATPEFWATAGFHIAVDDERFPVVRRELG